MIPKLKSNNEIQENIARLSEHFAHQRNERQKRRKLEMTDFEQIKETGFLLTCVPATHGGTWQSVEKSIRPICDMLKTLAHGDSSVALATAMHPAVLANWLRPCPMRCWRLGTNSATQFLKASNKGRSGEPSAQNPAVVAISTRPLRGQFQVRMAAI